jgi:ABC-type dipeptide/oligopeptide/nickel transport system ATPase subunit
MDARQEKIFEAWYDYDHAIDEDGKAYSKDQRTRLIQEAVQFYKAQQPSGSLQPFVSVGDFLHVYRDQYRQWAMRKNLKTPRKRF